MHKIGPLHATHLKVTAEVPELLVGDGLYGGGVDGARAVLCCQRQCVFSYRCLTGARVCRHKHTVALHHTLADEQMVQNASMDVP